MAESEPINYMKDLEERVLEVDEAEGRDKNKDNGNGSQPPEIQEPGRNGKPSKKAPVSQATILVRMAQNLELFHTREKDCYANFPVGDHHETWDVETPEFKNYISHEFFKTEAKTPNASAIGDALTTIKGIALYDRAVEEVYLKTIRVEDKSYFDLANPSWEVVEMSATGWKVTAPPQNVRFRRSKGMLPLPHPLQGGSVTVLREYLNLPDEGAFRLIVSYLLMTMHPVGPYPVLGLNGEQGSAKSTASKLLRAIIDPNVAPLRSPPRNEHDLTIAANNSWVIALDNLSGMETWLSDALSRLSTGGGFGTRTLYLNKDETLFYGLRPSILNGIDNFLHKMDLADRTILITLPPIPEDKRIEDKILHSKFKLVIPSILGGLCSAVAEALKNEKSVKLTRLPRMADFATFVTAAEPALPWTPGGFMNVYSSNQASVVETSLNEDIVGSAIIQWIEKEEKNYWAGTSSELLVELCRTVNEDTQKLKSWPKAANTLSHRLKRLSNFLRRVGIDVDLEGKGKRIVSIKQMPMNGDDERSVAINGDDSEKTATLGKCGDCGEEVTLVNRDNQLYLFNKDETDVHKCKQSPGPTPER